MDGSGLGDREFFEEVLRDLFGKCFDQFSGGAGNDFADDFDRFPVIACFWEIVCLSSVADVDLESDGDEVGLSEDILFGKGAVVAEEGEIVQMNFVHGDVGDFIVDDSAICAKRKSMKAEKDASR